MCIREDFAAGEVAFIMQLGALLEDLTVARARAGIEKLVHLAPQTARIVRGAEEVVVPAEQVRVGDVLREAGLAAGHEEDIAPYLAQGCTAIWVGVDGALAGCLLLADTVRTDSAQTVAAIRVAGVRPVLLTGDNEAAAEHIAGQLGIEEVHARCLPEDKLRYMDEAGAPVCMIGDGVNDAPALRRATVGIAMGGVGSDIAVDAADIALVDDEIRELPHLLALSRRMMRTIKLNLTFSMTLNFVPSSWPSRGSWIPSSARSYKTRAPCSSSSTQHSCSNGGNRHGPQGRVRRVRRAREAQKTSAAQKAADVFRRVRQRVGSTVFLWHHWPAGVVPSAEPPRSQVRMMPFSSSKVVVLTMCVLPTRISCVPSSLVRSSFTVPSIVKTRS